MTVIQKTIGRLPVNLGDYDTTRAYGKKNRVLLYGCEWESKVNNNTYAPAALNTTTGVITPDTTHWKLISGSYNTWLIDNGYKKADANNVKDGDLTQHEINEAVSEEIGDDSTPASIKGRIKTLETNVGEGGSVDERIAAEGAQHYLKSETYTKSEVNGMITTPDQEYVTVTATDQTTSVTDVLPATGEPDTVYRVGNWDGNQYDATVYSEYAWNESTSQYIHLRTKTQIGEVFDISAYHATGGTLATYSDLNDALNGVNGGVPQSLQRGGMSVKFVQSSDNKYVQFRCIANEFTTDTSYWQSENADNTLISYSKNLVESGAVSNSYDGSISKVGLIQGGYDSSTGSFTPNNPLRVSTIRIYCGLRYTLNQGYEITVINWYENDGTFIKTLISSASPLKSNYRIDRGYLTISLKHSDNSAIVPTESPFAIFVCGQYYNQEKQTNDSYLLGETQTVQGGISGSDGSYNPDNNARITILKIYDGYKFALKNGYKISSFCLFSNDGTFIRQLDSTITTADIDNGYYCTISIGHNSSYPSGDNSAISTEENPFDVFICGQKYKNSITDNNVENIRNLKSLTGLILIQGGYSGSDGSFDKTNTLRVSTCPVYCHLKYSLNSGYAITVVNWYENDGTYISQLPIQSEYNIDRGYMVMTVKHSNNSAIVPTENIFSQWVSDIRHFNTEINTVVGKLDDHTKWLSQYKESWSTLNCVPIFFKIANTGGSTYNLNIVINTDFHYHVEDARKISQWTDNTIKEGVNCFLCLGDMDWATGRPQKTLSVYSEHAADVWNMFVANKYNKAQLVTLGNHDLNVEAPVAQWATKAQQRAAYIQPMLTNYGSFGVNGIVTDTNNADGCYWYVDIESTTNKVRIIGMDVFDYPTPTQNTDSIVTPDTPNIDYSSNWVYWYFSDYLKDYPISGVSNRRDLGFSVKQLKFLINALATIPSGYTAIVCGHIFEHWEKNPSINPHTNWVGDSGRACLEVLKAFKNKQASSYTLTSPLSDSITFDFSSVASNEVFVLQGHNHNFYKDVFSGIKLFTLIATDGNYNKPINRMSSQEACDILVMSNDGADNAATIRFVRYGHVGRGTANLAYDTDLTADAKGFHYIDNPESIYD